MNYIGSKNSLIGFLEETIFKVTGFNSGDHFVFADLFAGTGVVGANFKSKGCTVLANDIQYYSFVLNKHYLENNLVINFDLFNYFNSLTGKEGFIYKNYCFGSGSNRNYFSNENGKKCDAIREEIERLFKEEKISKEEYFYFLACLLHSIDKYANTASVYGSFLKHIKKSANKEFQLHPLPIISGPEGRVFNEDINELVRRIEGDVLYLDPPYNSRQYCTNYHLLETIAKYDNPVIYGKTGLRDYRDQKSKYCSKKTVLETFKDLIASSKFKYIFLSYNNEGLMNPEEIKEIMSEFGEYSCFTKQYKQFKANKLQPNKATVEYLHCLVKSNFSELKRDFF